MRAGAHAAADVVSEVFLAAFRNRGRYDKGRADARPWLYGITTKVISQHLRTEQRRARALTATPIPRPAEFHVDEISDRVSAARLQPLLLGVLAELSPADQELVLLVAASVTASRGIAWRWHGTVVQAATCQGSNAAPASGERDPWHKAPGPALTRWFSLSCRPAR
jgi:DNA-directed RNA polymerase specialized sigma24 family protein